MIADTVLMFVSLFCGWQARKAFVDYRIFVAPHRRR